MPDLIDGIAVKLGGQEYTLAPLTIRQLKKLAPIFETLNQGGGVISQLDAVIELLHASFSRNYPDMTKDQLEDLLDSRTAADAMKALKSLSGLVSSGEAVAGGQ